jgi:DHA1 family tetracycline resistance protein-like MFS transporter
VRKPPPILAIFLTVFIDLLGFGLVIPDIQLRGDLLGATGLTRGLLLASFSIAQLLTAPMLGRWSDKVGRRNVLLLTTVLAITSYAFYANAELLWIMFAARILNGIAGANISVAYAYIADITKPQDRAKSFGLIGIAFGLGFIFGPVIGAHLIHLGGGHPYIMGYTAAGLSLLNFLFVFFFLPESRHHKPEPGESRSLIENMRIAFSSPALAILLALFFVYNFAFSNLESTYFLLAVKHFHLTQQEGSYILAFVGIVGAIMQGFIIRWAAPRFGEVRLIRFAFFLQIPAFALIPFLPPWAPQLFLCLFLGIGGGLLQPSISSLISRRTPREIQGSTFGVSQSLGALARITGPLVSNPLFDWRYWAPYALGSLVFLIPAGLAWRLTMPEDAHVIEGEVS